MPTGATAPRVEDNLISYTAGFRVGVAHASIQRLLEPAPEGASVTDRRFRSNMRDYLVDDMAATPHEEPTSIAGLPGWSACGAETTSDSGVNWHCAYYLVSGQHFYRLGVHALSPQKPPEFDAVVRALYGVSFVPARSPVGSDGRPAALPRKPIYRIKQGDLNQDWYPAAARSRGSQGVVDVEFSIDGQGRAQDLRVTYATSSDLTSRAGDFVRLMHFRVPSGWEASGARAARFTFESQYAIETSGSSCHFPTDPRVADAPFVTICSSRVH